MNIIGIDVGSTFTKLVEVDEKINIKNSMMVADLEVQNALDLFIKNYNINLNNIDRIVLTGIGRDKPLKNTYRKKIELVNEFDGIGTGGLFLTNKSKAIVVSCRYRNCTYKGRNRQK